MHRRHIDEIENGTTYLLLALGTTAVVHVSAEMLMLDADAGC